MKLVITFDEVKAAKPTMIYYSVNTVWWTHDPADVQKSKHGPPPGLCSVGPDGKEYPIKDTGYRLPVDIFGSPLFESDRPDEILNEDAIAKHPAYGLYPVRNFMLAHAKNIHLAGDLMPYRAFSLIGTYKAFSKYCDEQFKDRWSS